MIVPTVIDKVNNKGIINNTVSTVLKNGKEIERFYETVSEGTGSILRNILEDTLDEFDDFILTKLNFCICRTFNRGYKSPNC